MRRSALPRVSIIEIMLVATILLGLGQSSSLVRAALKPEVATQFDELGVARNLAACGFDSGSTPTPLFSRFTGSGAWAGLYKWNQDGMMLEILAQSDANPRMTMLMDRDSGAFRSVRYRDYLGNWKSDTAGDIAATAQRFLKQANIPQGDWQPFPLTFGEGNRGDRSLKFNRMLDGRRVGVLASVSVTVHQDAGIVEDASNIDCDWQILRRDLRPRERETALETVSREIVKVLTKPGWYDLSHDPLIYTDVPWRNGQPDKQAFLRPYWYTVAQQTDEAGLIQYAHWVLVDPDTGRATDMTGLPWILGYVGPPVQHKWYPQMWLFEASIVGISEGGKEPAGEKFIVRLSRKYDAVVAEYYPETNTLVASGMRGTPDFQARALFMQSQYGP
jgi:hypothetical protein